MYKQTHTHTAQEVLGNCGCYFHYGEFRECFLRCHFFPLDFSFCAFVGFCAMYVAGNNFKIRILSLNPSSVGKLLHLNTIHISICKLG